MRRSFLVPWELRGLTWGRSGGTEMEKTIVVGIGGTGLDTVRCLRRRIVETKGSLGTLPNLGFLYLDTDRNAVKVTDDNKKRWEVLGIPVALDDSEYETIEAPEIGPIINNINSFSQISDWFPADRLRSIDQSTKDTPGARQIRPLGRFAFTLKTPEVKHKFTSLYERLPQSPGGGQTQIYLVCSLSGGTGSGMFLDLAYRIQEWTHRNCKIMAFLVFPEMTTPRGERYLVNAYAALLELNYFSTGNQFQLAGPIQPKIGPPFDFCYIVSPRNSSNVELALETVPEMIAHRIFLNFDSSFAADAQSLLQNGSFERTVMLTDPFTKGQHSQNFFTFGLSSIQYPIEQLTEIFAYQLCAATTSGWLKEHGIPGNVAERVRGQLAEMKLTDDYLLGNKNIFGTAGDFDSYEREVENFVNDLKRLAPSQNIGATFSEKQTQFLEGQFRQVGVRKFYEAKKEDLNGAAESIGRLVRKFLSSVLADPELGHQFADKAIDEILRVCETKFKLYTETLEGLPAKESGSRRSLEVAYKRFTDAESKLLFRNKAIRQHLMLAGDAMRLNMAASIGLRAFDFGRSLLTLVIEDIKAIRSEVTDWLNNAERLHDTLEREIKTRKEYLAKKKGDVKGFNGTVLFDEKRVSAVYGQFDEPSAARYLQSTVLGESDKGLLESLGSTSAVAERMYLAAIEWLNSVSKVRVSDQNVADKMLEDYPTQDKRRDLIKQNFSKSKPFLAFDDYELQIAKGTEGGYVFHETTATSLVGFENDSERYPSVNVLQLDVTAATGIPKQKISMISDPHQILMLHEITAFPLRLICDLKPLKELYGQYVRNSGAIPVHIQTRFQPPLTDLFLTSDKEIRAFEETEEAFLIAWVEGKIKEETNRREQSNEVRYRYNEAGSDTFQRLGNDFENALDFCLANADESRATRSRLKDDIRRHMKTFDTQTKKKAFAQRLAEHLHLLRETIDPELKEESNSYKRYDEIRKRINQRFSLPTTALQATGNAVSTLAAPDGDNEEAFFRLVQTAIKSCGGNLTEAMTKMLENSQKRLKVQNSRAELLIRLVKGGSGEPPAKAEYRQMFLAFSEQGEISEEQRALLVSTQAELGLSDQEVEEIEKRAMGGLPQ